MMMINSTDLIVARGNDVIAVCTTTGEAENVIREKHDGSDDDEIAVCRVTDARPELIALAELFVVEWRQLHIYQFGTD